MPAKAPSLLRQLGVVSAAALVISNMVGTGIFTTTGFLAGDLGQTSLVLLIWVVGAACAMAGAFCYSELGINFPSSGGEYVYLTHAFGPSYGFMSGWVSFFAGFSAPIALAALAFSNYLGYFFPALRQESSVPVLGVGEFALRVGGAQYVASALVAVFTIMNFFGIKRVAAIQNLLTGLKIVVLLAFIVLGFTIGSGDWGNLSMTAQRTSQSSLFAQFAVSLLFIYLGYSGWNAATYVAEELRQPERTLPIALTLGTLLVAGLYVVLNVLFIYAVPLEQMKGQVAVGSLAASHLFGPGVAGTFSALMAVSLMATVNAMVTIGPRVYYAMAKNGAFVSAAAFVHERWRTPIVAIVFQGICAMIMTFTPFESLLFSVGFILNFSAVVTVASLFVFRRRKGWQRLKVVDFAWPLIPGFFIVVGLWLSIYGFMLRPLISVVAVAVVAAGALVYHFRVAKSIELTGRTKPV